MPDVYLRNHCHCQVGHVPGMTVGIANSVQLQWTLNGNGVVLKLGMLVSVEHMLSMSKSLCSCLRISTTVMKTP